MLKAYQWIGELTRNKSIREHISPKHVVARTRSDVAIIESVPFNYIDIRRCTRDHRFGLA